MPANDVSQNIIVKAKNESEATFNKVKADINGVKVANESMATSVFKGVASWDLLKTGVRAATEFIKSSIEASSKAQQEMAMVRQNVENAGIAYDSIKDKLDEYSKKMIQMGFDDEETATSMSRLMLVTKDYNKALTLNQLAGDLARNSGQGMEETTKALTMALGGNIRSLKLYVPELKAGASAAEVLAAVHEKVKGSMETFAATTEGKMQIMKVTYGNFKEQIGDIFGPALNVALTNFNNFLTAADTNAGVASESIASKLSKAFATAVAPSAWKAGGLQIWNEAIVKPAEKFGKFFVDISDKIYGTQSKIAPLTSERIDKTIQGLDAETNATVNAAMKTLELQKAIDNVPPSYDGMGAAGTDSMKKQKDAMQGVLDKLKDYKQSINDIQKAEEDESLAFIKSQVEKNQSFKQQLADMVKTHKEAWLQANKDREAIERDGIKSGEDLQRVGELKAKAEKEFAIIQPYLNDTEMAKLAETSDVERLITSHRAEQAQDTVDTAQKQADLAAKAQNIYINFDLKDTTITDKNFLDTVKKELNNALNTVRIAY